MVDVRLRGRDPAIVQDPDSVLRETLKAPAQEFLAAGADRPRLGALGVVAQREDDAPNARVRISDSGRPLGRASLVLSLRRRPGRPDDDVGRICGQRFRFRFQFSRDIGGREGYKVAGGRFARHWLNRRRRRRALEAGHGLGCAVVHRSGAGRNVCTTLAAPPGVPQAHLLRHRDTVIAHARHTRVIGPPARHLKAQLRQHRPESDPVFWSRRSTRRSFAHLKSTIGPS
jgi:hypothetical protein